MEGSQVFRTSLVIAGLEFSRSSLTFERALLTEFFFLFLQHCCSMWDLSSLTRDPNGSPCFGREVFQPLDHPGTPFNLHFYLNFYYQSLLLNVKVNLFKYINPSGFQ